MVIALIGLVLGAAAGLILSAPLIGNALSAIILLAMLNALIGGARACVAHKFDPWVFCAGMLANAGFAAALCVLGDRFDVPLELAVFVYFGYHTLKGFSSLVKALVRHPAAKPEAAATLPEEPASAGPAAPDEGGTT